MKNLFKFFLILILLRINIFAQIGELDSGGKLSSFQACYDVKFYDINLSIDTNGKAIGGFVIMRASAVKDFNKILVDLDTTFHIESIQLIKKKKEIDLTFKHDGGKVWINFPNKIKKGEIFSAKITYAGVPRIAKRPPWDEGFVWSKSKDGLDWVTVTCQGGGADVWWPCKDHPSDRPDSASLHFTVPSDLICIGSGKLKSLIDNRNKTKTWNWYVSTPINNYCVMFYLGPIKPLTMITQALPEKNFLSPFGFFPKVSKKQKSTHSNFFCT